MRDPVSVLDVAPSAQHMAVSLWLTVDPQLVSSGGYASSQSEAQPPEVVELVPVSHRLTAMCRGKATKARSRYWSNFFKVYHYLLTIFVDNLTFNARI